MNVLQAALISLLYVFGSCRVNAGFLGTITFTPMVLGWFVGLILGDLKQGTLLGATMQTVFMGVTYYGGAMPQDTRIATIVATAFAIVSGMQPEASLAIAVPFGALGVAMDPIWRTINTSVWGPYVDKAVEEVNLTKIRLGSGILPFITGALVSFPVVFIVLYFGQGVVNMAVANLPGWLTHALSVMGGLLPCLGFGMYIRVIGTPKTIPFFILGFYLMKFFNLSILGIAIFAFALAYTLLFIDKNLFPDA